MDWLSSVLSGIGVVSWDVDGTLYSFGRIAPRLVMLAAGAGATRGWGATSALLGETLQFHRAIEAQRRQPGSAVVERDLDRFSTAAAWERAMLEEGLGGTPVRPRALALIEHLAATGTPQAALSDFDCGCKVKALGLDARFSAHYSCRDLGVWKPSPIPLARIQHDFGVTPRQHLHIGDRAATDGASCAANGCHFLHIDCVPKCLPRSAGWNTARPGEPLLEPHRAGDAIKGASQFER